MLQLELKCRPSFTQRWNEIVLHTDTLEIICSSKSSIENVGQKRD